MNYEMFNTLGFKNPKSWTKLIVSTAIAIILDIFIIEPYISYPIVMHFGVTTVNPNFMFRLTHSSPYLALLLCFFLYGLLYEFIWRGLIFNFFMSKLKNFYSGKYISLFLQAILFGLTRINNGFASFITTFIFGIILGMLYIFNDNVLWAPIACRSIIDSLIVISIIIGL